MRSRVALRVQIGKGSPQEIYDEIKEIGLRVSRRTNSLADESLKRLLVENNIGIDCSGFAYYALNAESEELKKGSLDKNLNFVNCKGILGKIRCRLRPIRNCDVGTLASDENSRVVPLTEIKPGDIITILDQISQNKDPKRAIDSNNSTVKENPSIEILKY